MNSKVYKWCTVPLCTSTSIKTPNKLFVSVPQEKSIRYKWLTLARRDPTALSPTSVIYLCEDHFDMPNDMENYMQIKLMGPVTKIRMKPGCVPTKFDCQGDFRKRTNRPIILRRKREAKKTVKKQIVNDIVSGESTDTVITEGDSQTDGVDSDIFNDWSVNEDRQLIKLVRLQEPLYNENHEGHKNTELKYKLWYNIASALNKTDYKCMNRWNYLKHNYKTRKNKPPDCNNQRSKETYKLLSFLDNHISYIEENSLEENPQNCEEEAEEVIVKMEPDVEETDIDNQHFNEDHDYGFSEQEIKVQRSNSTDSDDSNLQRNYNNVDSKSNRKELKFSGFCEELDETDLYFKSLSKIVKKLPWYDQAQLRLEISNLVFKAELKYISQSNTDPLSN